MPPAQESTETTPAVRRSSRASWALIAAAGVAAIGAFATLFSVWARTTTPGLTDTLRIATDEYTAGRPAVAANLAQSVSFPDDFADQDLIHLREFLIGAGRAAAADPDADHDAWRLAMHEAIPHLKAAEAHGFPPGREADGQRLLGEALRSKGRFREAATRLATAIEVDPTLRRQLLPRLIESQLLAPDIPPERAVESTAAWLKWLTPNTPDYFHALLLRGRALIKQQQWPSARDQFRKIIDHSKDRHLIREARLQEAGSQVAEAMWLQQQAAGEAPTAVVREILDEAMTTLAELEREPDTLFAARTKLWIARAHRALGESAAAILAATSVRQHRPFNAESIAGGTLEVELLADEGRGSEVLQTARFLIREIGDPRLFDGRIISIDEFRKRLTAVANQLRENGLYQNAIDLARVLPPVFAPDDALMLEAVAFSDWGEHTLRIGRQVDGMIPTDVAALARQHFHAAGDAFAAAAAERFTSAQYVPTLWMAIAAYEKSRDFARTLQLIDPYLRYEDRPLKPRGLLTQGRALLALDQPREALAPLQACIAEHPRDSLRYEARLTAALAHAELNQLPQARQLLDDNLYDGTLAPESPVWRDSLNLLGRLLYREAYRNHLLLTEKLPDELAPEDTGTASFRENQELLEQAIRRLEESARREALLVQEDRLKDPLARRQATSRSQNASYLAARSHQMAAYWPGLQAALPDVLDTARRRFNQTRDEHLHQAMQGFATLRHTLASLEEDQPLSDTDTALMRNCFLAEADVMRQRGQWTEAAEAYRSISLRYMNQPAALEAMLGQARCMENLGRQREAKAIIRQAERVLQRIPPTYDNRFAETTRYDRQQWQRLFAWLASPDTDA